ncbi:MAG: SET domain-containing protein-lysine N-methyltransferase [Nanoarchaeota archaeon]
MKDLHELWPHRWITSKAKSFNSPVNGKGVIATSSIKKGEIVMVIGGIIVPREGILKYREILGHIGIQIADNFWIVPTTRTELEETGCPNHSCSPNIGFDGPITYVALRDIKIGEEIFLDYAFMETYFEQFDCKCGNKNCRKMIKPTDWQIPELQKRYKQYFSPYIKKKFS